MTMRQKKVDLKLEWGPPPEGDATPQRMIRIQEHTDPPNEPEWTVALTETEFLELAELIYVEYCAIRRRAGVHNQPDVGQSGGSYYISLRMYSSLMPLSLFDSHTESLGRLLAVSGTREDLLAVKQLCAISGQHGYVAMIDIVLEDRP